MSLQYLKKEVRHEVDFLNADTNLGKLNVNLIIVAWVSLKMGETFSIMGL